MGADRWGQGPSGSSTQGSGYRNSYNRGNYRGDSNFGGYGNSNFGHGGSSEHNHTTAIGQKSGAAAHYGPKSVDNSEASSSVAALEKKLVAAQSEMSQALQEATSKENEKFDLIFSILMELQTRQSKLEDSLKFLKGQYEPSCGQPQMMTPMPSGQGDGSMASSMGSPMGSQGGMMAPQMGMVGGQMPMNQQCGNMVMMDSAGNCMVPVLMAMPQNGGQTQFTQMMMPQGATMQGATMQAMPQQQVQFAASSGEGPDGCGDFQWNGGMQANMGDASSTTAGGQDSTSSSGSGTGSGPGTARSTAEQTGSADPSKTQTMDPSSQNLMLYEEE